jgi:copper chaperone NosL
MFGKNKNISKRCRILMIVCGLALISVLFVPFWQILLDAPQYPEGLTLKIHANKLSGDVDIINGLNHYIGMKTIHENDFVEFKVLPYCILAFSLLFIIVGLVGKRLYAFLLLIVFILFGIIAMVDFWKWEYNYGHDLDPDAAIKVPGMAYQPPLIGYKQLLNFIAGSFPDIGGWIFIACGIILMACVILGRRNKAIG